MKLNNKGVSMIALTVTLVIIIIIANITVFSGFQNVEKAEQAVFLAELESAVDAVRVYNERATEFGVKGYSSSKLGWDGKSVELTNSGKLKYLTDDFEGKKINPKFPNEEEKIKIENAHEDTIVYLLNKEVPSALKDKVYI